MVISPTKICVICEICGLFFCFCQNFEIPIQYKIVLDILKFFIKFTLINFLPIESSNHRMNFGLPAIDYIVIGVYLVIMFGVGFYFSRFMKGGKDFFVRGDLIPWWIAGVSLYMTLFSGWTFTGDNVNKQLVNLVGDKI